MKLALIGKNISHSLSPKIYRDLLGEVTYDLLDFSRAKDVPSLQVLSKNYDGLNITSPYKQHFLNDVIFEDESVRALGGINTIKFKGDLAIATNTDYLALKEIFQRYVSEFKGIKTIILGDGVMGKMALQIAQGLGTETKVFSRKKDGDISHLDLRFDFQVLVINTCSRDFHFQGTLEKDAIFWDLNYHFKPHQNSLPLKIKAYHDGQEMLLLQAKEAVKFWERNKA